MERIPPRGGCRAHPVLDQYAQDPGQELTVMPFCTGPAGGVSLLDCQPGGCGRNVGKLLALSQASGVRVVACTGFYLRRSYNPDYWLWHAPAEEIERAFTRELSVGIDEVELKHADHPAKEALSDEAITLRHAQGDRFIAEQGDCFIAEQGVRAGVIKVACESTLAGTPQAALEGAAASAAHTGAALEIHTEKGADAETIFDFFVQRGVQPRQVVICHIDKRPDFGLHDELARAGALLEYDTFYRPYYAPETGAWPLIEHMVAAGLETGPGPGHRYGRPWHVAACGRIRRADRVYHDDLRAAANAWACPGNRRPADGGEYLLQIRGGGECWRIES